MGNFNHVCCHRYRNGPYYIKFVLFTKNGDFSPQFCVLVGADLKKKNQN